MTELEFAKLLGDLPEEYIHQAQAFRSGSYRAMGTGSKGKRALGFLAAAVLAVAMLGGFFWALKALQAQREAVEQATVDGWQEHVLRGAETFWSETYQEALTLEEYTRKVQQEQTDPQCAPWSYAALDMDQDGRSELAVRFQSSGADVLTLILWREQGKTVSRAYTKQQMYFLKEDGTFYYSSENHWGWGRLERRGNDYVPVIRVPQGDSYGTLEDAAWKTLSGAAIPAQTRSSCKNLGLSGKSGVSGYIYGALTEMEDYSLYLPITGWIYEQTSPYATVENADSWYCEDLPEARLTIFKTEYDSTTWQKPGYVFKGATAYTLEMHKGTSVLQVYVRLGENANYVMELEYPEDFWDKELLKSMLYSLRFTRSTSANREPEWTLSLDDAMLDVVLFVDRDYSLYLPKEWDTSPVTETIGQRSSNSWYSRESAGISIVKLGQCSPEEARAWAVQSLSFDSTKVQEDGSILGSAGNSQIWISFRQDGIGQAYAVIRCCPTETAEESQALLNALADSVMFSSEA